MISALQRERILLPVVSPGSATERLRDCAAVLRDHVAWLRSSSGLGPAAVWLVENFSYLQFQIREIRHGIPASYLRALPRVKANDPKSELRVYCLALQCLSEFHGNVDPAAIAKFGEQLKADRSLMLGELWAFESILKLAILQRLCSNLESEPAVSAAIRSLRALETVTWCDFVESVSEVEAILRRDPAQIYPNMDFTTRDWYRHVIEEFARKSHSSEMRVAAVVLNHARKASIRDPNDHRCSHVGYYLVGPGARDFRNRIHCASSMRFRLQCFFDRWPSLFYVSGLTLFTVLLMVSFVKLADPLPVWILALLAIPASQAALEVVNALVSRLLPPRPLPCMDFTEGIPVDCKTMVVVPTLILSAPNVARLLEDLEIRYLANRQTNLYFALLTDFPDASQQETANDSVLANCVEGIQRLNIRYNAGGSGPFYLFHRPRRWNPAEAKWMGHERKRGKLNDLNEFLLGRANCFGRVVGDATVFQKIRYIITLDTDTQLPLDTGAKIVAAAAHPLNQAIVDTATQMVCEGYGLIRPRVAVSMESSWRSRLAQIFSGQAGFDPYATAVSDVYQDLHGQASFIGKGIYDLRAFDAAVGHRFPDNAILSHDMIEGEYARTGLLTSVELVEDYPSTYQAFSKRKHRWVRGDWQLLPWLFGRAPGQGGNPVVNPLPFLARWKIFDNLRRSLLEIATLCLLMAGWIYAADKGRFTFAVVLLFLLGPYADLLLTIVPAPERRLWPAFLHNAWERILQTHRNALLVLVFIPHQACMMADAIVRTLIRLFVTKRNLLEWETMAQSELSDGPRIGMVDRYFYIAGVFSAILLSAWPHPFGAVIAFALLWLSGPLAAAWLDQPMPQPEALSLSDHSFLRDTALRTWRFFADHASPEHHWLVPDNVQLDPPLEAARISPTNLGILATAQLSAYDFGYVTLDELTLSLRRIFDSMEKMPRFHGHFFNWYDTRTLQALEPQYVSTVDSGNLAASLCTLRQGCHALLRQPVFGQATLDSLRDHVLRLREELPYGFQSIAIMRVLASVLRELESQPQDLLFWEAILTDLREMLERVHVSLVGTYDRIEKQNGRARVEELQYWERLLTERVNAALSELYGLAPWLEPSFESDLRLNVRDQSLTSLFTDLCQIPALAELPDVYERIRTKVIARLESLEPLYPALRQTLEELLRRLPEARSKALDLIHRAESTATTASRFFNAMDFGFLFDSKRKLLRVGYDVRSGHADACYYDLLASEARTAVFLAIAKGDIPREAWFRLARKLTAYRNHRTLVSWSGTMFEYLMPLIHMKSYRNTLLDRGIRGALSIQQTYAAERRVPWGVSEAAFSSRDALMQYQYRAFGIPAMSARTARPDHLVVSPYSTMLALMLDPRQSTANLRLLAANGCLGRYGFFESLDYRHGQDPEIIRCFMTHHQGMGLLAIGNALLGWRMQERFHLDPQVHAAEFLLHERMPALVEVSDAEQAAA